LFIANGRGQGIPLLGNKRIGRWGGIPIRILGIGILAGLIE
jgi:hypothetical protein